VPSLFLLSVLRSVPPPARRPPPLGIGFRTCDLGTTSPSAAGDRRPLADLRASPHAPPLAAPAWLGWLGRMGRKLAFAGPWNSRSLRRRVCCPFSLV
jgi:hypothetical protein